MMLPTLEQLRDSASLIYQHMQASPQLQWPLLSQRCGCEVWVKHENHNPTGAFKVRGGLVYLRALLQREPGINGLVTATRGNHGQSIAFAAQRLGTRVVIVVPRGNNPEKNRAMISLGAELIEHGADFDEAVPLVAELAGQRDLHRIPSFHEDLVRGVATSSLEMLQAVPDLERLYVPIGLGSGVSGAISARNALGLKTEIIGVVSDQADCYARSLAAGRCEETASADTLADGMAVRIPNAQALEIMQRYLERVVSVSDPEILQAMSYYFTDTHNIAEGAGAAPLAALLKDRAVNRGKKVGVVLSGGNADRTLYRQVLQMESSGTA